VEIIIIFGLHPKKDVTVAETRLLSHKNTKIGQTVRPLQVRKQSKSNGGVKNRQDDGNFTHMYNRPLRDRNTKVCMWGDVPDVITAVKFAVDRFCSAMARNPMLYPNFMTLSYI